MDDLHDILVKDYKIETSMDNVIWDLLISTTNTSITVANSENRANYPSLIYTLPSSKLFRYLKITMLSGYNRGAYQWTAIAKVKLSGILNPLHVAYKDENNKIYGYK